MYLVELGGPGVSDEKPAPESSARVERAAAASVPAARRYCPIRSLEEIEAEANQSDQSGLDVVIGNYRKETGASFDFSTVFEFAVYAYQRVRSYFR